MIEELVLKNRSYRRFKESERITDGLLMDLVELARLCPSSRNQQALKFKLITKPQECKVLFPSLAWAGYLKEWNGPVTGERPAAYIIIMGDKNLGNSFSVDLGICSQTILLGAVEKGLGGCMIGSIKKTDLRDDFNIPEYLEILLVIALGKPDEHIVIEEIKDGDIRYWRDQSEVHHVPKRSLSGLLK